MWYENGLKFECTRCGKCCTGRPGFVWVRMEDICRIADFLGMKEREFMEKYVRLVHNGYSLIEKPNGDCIFYDHGCSIYPVRPSQCSTFPFWTEIVQSSTTWEKAANECPGMNQGKVHTKAEILEILKHA